MPAQRVRRRALPRSGAQLCRGRRHGPGEVGGDWVGCSLDPIGEFAALAGLRKKERVIVREGSKGGGFAYRIVVVATDPANDGGTGEDKPLAGAGDGTGVTRGDPGVANYRARGDGAGEA